MTAIPEPLFYTDDNNLQIMTATDVTDIHDQVVALYAANQTVTLNNDTNVNLTAAGYTALDGLPMADTRLTSGAASVGGAGYVAETTTQEPQIKTSNMTRIGHITTSGLTLPTLNLPIYRRGDGDIQTMTPTDFLDTFIRPAITLLTSASTTTQQGGTYRVHTATTLSGHTRVGTTYIYQDTRADTSEFLAANIGTAGTVQDIPETIQGYYLLRVTPAAASTTIKVPAFKRLDNNIQAGTLTSFNSLLEAYVRYATTQSVGDRIKYQVATSAPSGGAQRGTSITDTALTGGAGVYTQRLVNSNDYRSQEFPDGTPATSTTYGFYIVRF